MNPLSLIFPTDRSIGTVTVGPFDRPEEWFELCEARGNVIVPSGKEVRLFIDARVDFDPNLLSNFDPQSLAILEWVSSSRITDEAISHIQHLSGLKGLAVWETSLGDDGLAHIRHLHNLQWLDIGDTKITDNGLAELSELPLLYDLSLLNDCITDEGLRKLTTLVRLRGLDLMHTRVTDAGIEVLGNMNHLASLRIFETGITEAGYVRLRTALPNCQINFHDPHFAR